MSVSTSLSNSNQLYPSSSSDNQWNQDTSNPQSGTQFLVGDQQYQINAVNCNGSSAIYNTPKIPNVNNFCINEQMQFNPPNYVGTCAPAALNAEDIRFQNTYNSFNNPRAMIHTPRNGNLVSGVNNAWAVGSNRVVARPTWNTVKPISGGVKKTKRIRTAFTSQQMMELENEYARARYLDRSRRIELSEILKLNERTIKIWFQNRRMKEKKDKSESLEEAEATSTTEPPPSLGGGQQMVVYDSYPHNNVFNRNLYVEQYPMATGMTVQQTGITPPVESVENLTTLNSYSSFVVDNNLQLSEFDTQCRQMNMQIENYSINTTNEALCEEGNLDDSPIQSENSTNDASRHGDGENWDLSWIRSIHIDEEM